MSEPAGLIGEETPVEEERTRRAPFNEVRRSLKAG